MIQHDSENERVILSTGKVLTFPTTSIDSPKHDETEQAVVNRIKNVWGSSSGAGSDFLDKYRKERALEMSRLEEMDKKWKEDMENKLFHSQRMYRIKKETDKTMKRKLRREKKKNKIASLKKGVKTNESEENYFSKADGSGPNSTSYDLGKEIGNNYNNCVADVSNKNYSEINLKKYKGSLEKKSNLIIIDKEENDI